MVVRHQSYVSAITVVNGRQRAVDDGDLVPNGLLLMIQPVLKHGHIVDGALIEHLLEASLVARQVFPLQSVEHGRKLGHRLHGGIHLAGLLGVGIFVVGHLPGNFR